jgi:hypothetical protein
VGTCAGLEDGQFASFSACSFGLTDSSIAFSRSQWNEIVSPLLYRNIQLSQPASYSILASLLTSTDPEAPPVAKWIKRAVLREVPHLALLDKESDVGKVIASLRDLEIFKVRYRTRQDGEENLVALLRGQPDVWELYPNVNPKV